MFPPEACRDETDETEGEDSTTEAISNDFKPSSMAISFAIEKHAVIDITVTAGRYERDGTSKGWNRKPLEEKHTYEVAILETVTKEAVFGSSGRLDITKRPFGTGFIITVALSNGETSGDRLKPEQCLYQSQLSVCSHKGNFKQYPSSNRFKLDQEQQELALTFRKRIPWAVGHGVAVEWGGSDADTPPGCLSTQALPQHEVKGFTTDLDESQKINLPDDILNIHHIADEEGVSGDELLDKYDLLIDAYNSWVDGLEDEQLDPRFAQAKESIIERLRKNASRMYDGIEKLRNNTLAMQAFRLANRAMLMQMIHSGKDFAGKPKDRDWGYQRPEYNSDEWQGRFNWRPFQLAFQLLVLESLIPDKDGSFSNSHSNVDLLWFPTGGGKTEAYLAVAAWEMIYRRMTLGVKGGGTAVVKRYTLRLLTSQQFQRAGTLICALEVLRQENPELLGDENFSLGLWVGQDTSPNMFKDAHEKYELARESNEPENQFQLHVCPWCGTNIMPRTFSEREADFGIRCNSHDNFQFYCPSASCEFHKDLPIQVVDQALYKHPPTLLIGTVDKFARLTWKAEANSFFGDNKKAPPSLIIQDELHLISGPLGTVSGIYEAGFDSIIESLGKPAKIIASTATIRSAEQQVNRLFGRKVNVFPPSGTDQADSFFSKEDQENPGRLYLGVMPSGHTGQTAMVQTAAAMLQSTYELGFDDKILDSYWTLPIYHNSRRELGKTMTLARDDIPARIEVIAQDKDSARRIDSVEELSANVKGPRIPDVLAKVEREVGHEAVDVLPCTNMISVGVDIGRLGMMLVAGQPKSTAEYIQASSRVGRDKKRPPGIVVTLYSPTKPRDRSHYEMFKNYHQALYRYVEPTSVTPWALPAVERALHASLIALVRVTGYLRKTESAANFDKDAQDFQKLLVIFKRRLKESMEGMDLNEAQQVFTKLDNIINDWHERAKAEEINCFDATKTGNQFKPLFKVFEDIENFPAAWRTLNSMRSVDTETHLLVRGEK